MKIENYLSLPAYFTSISPNSESPLYTRGKLKIFYVGETVDHRIFTEEFSKKLMRTLPYTPVVGYYNTDKDDFNGHANNQFIYGIVDPMNEPKFELDAKGTKWAICDVIIYTERPDETGEVARRIEGHPESLEMNPKTVQYKINRDSTGRFKSLEFTEGQFIGVSVLGKDENPAFPGAQFFNSTKFKEEIETNCTNRGTKMNVTIPSFVKQSWSETYKAVAEALEQKFVDGCYLVDIYDEYCIAYIYDAATNDATLNRIPYTCEIKDGKYNVQFGDAVRVHVTYEDMRAAPIAASVPPAQGAKPVTEASAAPAADQVTPTPAPTAPVAPIAPISNPAQAACGDGGDDESDEDKKKKEADKKKKEEEEAAEAKKKKDAAGCAAVPVEQTAENNNADVQTNSAGEAPLSNDQLKELENYRRKDKIELIESFKEILDEKDIKDFESKVDALSKEDLTNALNAKTVEVMRSGSNKFNSGFGWIPDNQSNSESGSSGQTLAERIAARKNRGNK
jgi:hypothetical protein